MSGTPAASRPREESKSEGWKRHASGQSCSQGLRLNIVQGWQSSGTTETHVKTHIISVLTFNSSCSFKPHQICFKANDFIYQLDPVPYLCLFRDFRIKCEFHQYNKIKKHPKTAALSVLTRQKAVSHIFHLIRLSVMRFSLTQTWVSQVNLLQVRAPSDPPSLCWQWLTFAVKKLNFMVKTERWEAITLKIHFGLFALLLGKQHKI